MPLRASITTVFFILSYFAVALVLPSLPLYPDTSLVTFHIQSLLAYLRVRYNSVAEREGGGDNANMETYVGMPARMPVLEQFFL